MRPARLEGDFRLESRMNHNVQVLGKLSAGRRGRYLDAGASCDRGYRRLIPVSSRVSGHASRLHETETYQSTSTAASVKKN